MQREDQFLLELLRGSLWGKAISVPSEEIDWELLIKNAEVQAVFLQAFDGAAAVKDHIPSELYATWQKESFRRLRANMLVTAAQAELVELLQAGGYPYVILKGAAAAAYYPAPHLRMLGDVDFLIDPKQKEEIAERLMAKGFTRSHEEHICHQVFKKTGSHLEMHHEPAGIPNGAAGAVLRERLAEAWKRGQEQGDFCAPAPVDHGLILLLHMQHHMVGEGLGLRHLCDWGCFVHATHQEPFWQEQLLPLLSEVGLLRYMNVMTAACVRAFEIARPSWLEAVENDLIDAVLEDVLLGGNFGRKDPKRAASGLMISNHGKDGVGRSKAYYLYDTLHRSTLEQYPAAQKNIVLAFLLDCGRAMIYLGRVLTGKRYSLLSLNKDADRRAEVYRRMKIFEQE